MRLPASQDREKDLRGMRDGMEAQIKFMTTTTQPEAQTWRTRLKAARGQLSQSQAAKAISPSMSVRTLQEWEYGRGEPPLWAQELVLERLQKNK